VLDLAWLDVASADAWSSRSGGWIRCGLHRFDCSIPGAAVRRVLRVSPVLLPTQASVDQDHGSWGGRGRSRKLGDGETNPRFSRRFPIRVLWTTPPSVQSVTQSLPRGHGLSTPRARKTPGHSGSSRHQPRTGSLHKFRSTWPIWPGTPRLFPSRSTGNTQHLHPVEHGGKPGVGCRGRAGALPRSELALELVQLLADAGVHLALALHLPHGGDDRGVVLVEPGSDLGERAPGELPGQVHRNLPGV